MPTASNPPQPISVEDVLQLYARACNIASNILNERSVGGSIS